MLNLMRLDRSTLESFRMDVDTRVKRMFAVVRYNFNGQPESTMARQPKHNRGYRGDPDDYPGHRNRSIF